ncbi:hypothetical protein EV650_5881 [Kribbella kalugense]|uniref:Uncharacterized protein n=1 Tax=Kribbella kalugense TaxID=2512221 RepID=A0A4R7ZP33_9ACTN|nr:hypothetical protein EV650_5881 [Kribbella kalugense]
MRMARARGVLDGVFGVVGPPGELLVAARVGIEEIDRIASQAGDMAEEMALLDLCEPLEQVVEELGEVVGDRS